MPTRPDVVHYLVYKPAGVTSTVRDEHAERLVVDLVPPEPRVHPVGRLDRDSEGLMILTNDGDLTNLVTHPRYGITKTYVARVAGVPTPAALGELTAGVELDDGPARAHKARLTGETGDEALVELVMGEGRKREVRRMLAAVGHPVVALVRIAIGGIRDRELAPGTWRSLTVSEVRALYMAAEYEGQQRSWDDPSHDDD